MQRVHAVGVGETRQVRGTADAANHYNLVWLKPKLEQGDLKGRQYREIAAARTPVGVDFAFVTLFDELNGRFDAVKRRDGFDNSAHIFEKLKG
jgi:hypothetical protein